MITIRDILIADDHAIFREGLKQVLRKVLEVRLLEEAGSGQEVLTKVRERDYDLLILDISMPGKSGLDILSAVKTFRPDLPVLVFSMYAEEQYVMRALRLGASGYMTKGNPPGELLDALHKISLGKRYVSPSMAECLIDSFKGTASSPHNPLSNREFQVLCMIASGKTVGMIAAELSLSVKTISAYRAGILGKMKLRNNAELTRYAIENGLA